MQHIQDETKYLLILQVRAAKMVGLSICPPWWSCDMASGFGCILSLELWNQAAAESSQCLLAHCLGEREICWNLARQNDIKNMHRGERLHVFGEKMGDRWNDKKCSEHLRTFWHQSEATPNVESILSSGWTFFPEKNYRMDSQNDIRKKQNNLILKLHFQYGNVFSPT